MLNVTKSINQMKNLSCLLLERKMAAKTITPPDILEQSWRTSIENHTAGFFPKILAVLHILRVILNRNLSLKVFIILSLQHYLSS